MMAIELYLAFTPHTTHTQTHIQHFRFEDAEISGGKF